jgi:hypothetical protein
MSYKTKISLATVIGLALVYGAYFLWAWRPGHSAPEIFIHIVGAAILLIAVMIALATAVAVREVVIVKSGGRIDERDQTNELRSARNGYYALISLIWPAPFVVLAGASPVLVANLALAVLVLAEMVHFGSRVVYDLRGV